MDNNTLEYCSKSGMKFMFIYINWYLFKIQLYSKKWCKFENINILNSRLFVTMKKKRILFYNMELVYIL